MHVAADATVTNSEHEFVRERNLRENLHQVYSFVLGFHAHTAKLTSRFFLRFKHGLQAK